jgi:glutaredoxin
MYRFTIYGPVFGCGYTIAARDLLNKRGIPYKFHELQSMKERSYIFKRAVKWPRLEGSRIYKHTTVPVIRIGEDGALIGGYTDLVKYLAEEEDVTGSLQQQLGASSSPRVNNQLSAKWLRVTSLLATAGAYTASRLLRQAFLEAHDDAQCRAAHGRFEGCTIPKALGRQGKAGFVAEMTCGRNNFIIKREKVSWFVKYYRKRSYIGPNPPKNMKHVNRWIGMSEFMNEALIGFLLNTVNAGSPQVAAFMCPNDVNGYIVQEKAQRGDFASVLSNNTYSRDVIADLTLNIVHTLLRLEKNYNFTHGDAKPQNVLVYSIGDRYVAQLTDFGKSSITWNGVRIFNRLRKHKQLVTSAIALPRPVAADGTYTIGSKAWVTGANARHRRFIYYLNYDIYTFMILVALTDSGKDAIDKSTALQSIWVEMWPDTKTRNLISTKIDAWKAKTNVNLNSINTAYEILRDVKLRMF